MCKVNRSKKDDEIIGIKPKKVEKGIHVTFDNNKGEFTGLPTLWRELLEMPLNTSKNEVSLETLDPCLGPMKPTQKILF